MPQTGPETMLGDQLRRAADPLVLGAAVSAGAVLAAVLAAGILGGLAIRTIRRRRTR